jgi:hypothetical protein
MGFDLEMNNLAFDLDGVFIPDCDQIPLIGDVENFLKLTLFMQPIFRPAGKWNIITGRLKKHSELTHAWVNTHFMNLPQMIWHDNIDESAPWSYKASVINENSIDTYIESDWRTTKYLRSHTNCEVLHFGEFVSKFFNHSKDSN